MSFRVGVEVAVILVSPFSQNETAGHIVPSSHTSVLKAESLRGEESIKSCRPKATRFQAHCCTSVAKEKKGVGGEEGRRTRQAREQSLGFATGVMPCNTQLVVTGTCELPCRTYHTQTIPESV